MNKNKLPDYDIAIVGGGASGIYTAWRMLLEGKDQSKKIKSWIKERGELKIGVFEGSDRIGGRILSAKAPGLPNTVLEIGGMRYVSSQILVKSLVENKFDLKRYEQAVSEKDNLAYLRGKKLRIKDLSRPKKLPYKFSKEEKMWLKANNGADNFIGYAINKVIPEISEKKLTGQALRDYLIKYQFNGIPLYKIGFWNLISPVLSHEAYEIAVTTVGYDCLGFNTNAVDAICEYFEFTPGVKYYLLRNGYESLFWKMEEEFLDAGGDIIKEKWLKGFDSIPLEDGTSGIEMNFKDEDTSITTREIILAMPQRSIELLERKGPVLDPDRAPSFQKLLNSVVPIHLYKMFIAYDRPWWTDCDKKLTEGRSVTDIQIRQCYYWPEDGEDPNKNPKNRNAILMVYNDAISSDYWGGLRLIARGPGNTNEEESEVERKQLFNRKNMPFQKLVPASENPWNSKLHNNWKKAEAPAAMVAEMHRQLKLMHGVQNKDIPEPLEAAFFDWGDDPYGGAVHFWNPGYNSSQVIKEMVQPVKGVPCYICGEAYSTNQTWVEGAFQTSELVLREFGIQEPVWLNKT